MITNLENLEGIGTGKLERIVMARLRMDVDFLRGIQEVIERQRDPNRGHPFGCLGR